MSCKLARIGCAAACLAFAPARAATVDIHIADSNGRPAANAVVALTGNTAPAAPSRLPAEAVIDQRNETFIPLVSIVRKGGRVVFANHDTTMHQVYSFSSVRQFAFEMDAGRRSEPVVFKEAGIASIGCNIHDRMITYVYVADTPWVTKTDETGHAQIDDVPLGNYRVEVWHPLLLPGRPLPSSTLAVTGASRFAQRVALLSPPPKRMHMGRY